MRFAVSALLFAGAVSAATTYITDVITITSCAPTVTNCPARSTVTSTTSYPVVPQVTLYSTVASTIYSCPASVTNCPSRYKNSTSVPVPATSVYVVPGYSAPVIVAPVYSTPVSAPSVVTVTVSACPISLASSIPVVGTTGIPYPVVVPSGNATTPSTPKFTGAAPTLSGSFAFVGLAGLAALFA